MKRKLFASICFFICLISVCLSQSQSPRKLKKGFYKNFQECVDNAPSTFRDFEVTYIPINNGNNKIVAATIKLKDSSPNAKIDSVWGFCDGESVFVDVSATTIPSQKQYWKLQCRGHNPYYYYSYGFNSLPDLPLGLTLVSTNERGTGPTHTNTIGFRNNRSQLREEEYLIGFIDEYGDYKPATKGNLKKLFASKPELLKRFKKESDFTIVEKIEYLKEFNNENR